MKLRGLKLFLVSECTERDYCLLNTNGYTISVSDSRASNLSPISCCWTRLSTSGLFKLEEAMLVLTVPSGLRVNFTSI